MGTNENYSGSFILNDEDRYQAIFASQNYGTFYVIYAKINFKKQIINNEEVSVLDNIDFKLINYKGLINLGFLNDKGKGIDIRFDERYGELKLLLKIKGLKTNDQAIKKYEGNPIKYSDIKEVYIDRKIKKLAENGEREVNGVYDTEYFFRSGQDSFERKPSRGMSEEEDTITRKAFNGNCEESRLTVIEKVN